MLGYNYAWNQHYTWSTSYGLEFRVFPPSMDPTIFMYYDLIYLKRNHFPFLQGHLVGKLGLAVKKNILSISLPIMVGVTYNSGFFKNELQLSVPFLLSQNKNNWLGIDFGIRL